MIVYRFVAGFSPFAHLASTHLLPPLLIAFRLLPSNYNLLPPVSVRAGPEVPGPSGAFVAGQEAEARRSLFNRIAPVYDELNDMLSFGQHRYV